MPISTRTRADDVRALAGAIVLGSSAGLVIGAVYLASSGSKPAPRPVPNVSGPLQARTGPTHAPILHPAAISIADVTAPNGAARQSGLALRDRFRVAAQAFHAVAQPFHFQQVADTPSDLHCLTEAVYFEARGEAPAGQQAVAQVVLNRVRHPAFPKTICAVVHQRTGSGCQFTFACSPAALNTSALNNVAWRRAQAIASSEMHGAVMKAVGDATHFQAARASPFAGLLEVAQIGAHAFYRFGGHAGAPAMFHQTPGASSEPAKIQVARLDDVQADEAARPVSAAGRIKVTLYPASTTLPATAPKPDLPAVKLVAVAPPEAKAAAPGLAHAVSAPSSGLSPASAPMVSKPAPMEKPAVLSLALAQS